METKKFVEYVLNRTTYLEGAFCSRCGEIIEIADDGQLGNNSASASSDLADEEDPDRRQF